MDLDEPFDNELSGSRAGINPAFGDWQHRFDFAPVSYASSAERRGAFRDALQRELKNRFFYSSEVRLEIVLRLDVQTILETDATADVDNYAKAILDGLKGPGGILLDDTQVQAMTISWLDSYGQDRTCFNVALSSSADDFILKPVEFYEMPDRLWYPHSRMAWDAGCAEALSDRDHYAGLIFTEMASRLKKEARHAFRQKGMDRLRAYQHGRYFPNPGRGFHKSRIDDGFVMHSFKAWKDALNDWKSEHVGDFLEVEQLVSDFHSSIQLLTR